MIVFLLAILLIYGLLHFYIYYKIKTALALGAVDIILVIFFMAIMVLSPIAVRLSERYGFESFARYLSYIGYTWMGLAFLFFSCSLPVDIYRLLIYTGGLAFKVGPSSLLPSPQLALMIPAVMSVAITFYGYFEARSIRTERVVIESPKIPEHIGRITIAQISDVHLGLTVRHGRLKRILREVARAKPDIVVSTGDLVDGQIDNLGGLAELLRDMHAPYGKFAVTGNHEFYAGLDQALTFTEKAGFTILRAEVSDVAGILTIAGIDDPTAKRFGLSRGISETSLLSKLDHERFTILLKHQPVVDRKADNLFDLQLSGHTHGGQIFPFAFLVGLFYPADQGLSRLEHGSYLYVTRGSGTWGPTIRFLAPPEVTIIELVHKDT
ncbi:MAG: metallophosphoesterase [Deltaproteobacteria bacterium]|nr:metallophosphoesterase [Deltaproteobacteria bacterium]MBW2309933.1 metallophosphoesterase [Deltaproteobacteria bacterium]